MIDNRSMRTDVAPPTRVLHAIETSGPGGAENMLINNVLELRRRGIEGDVLLLKDGWVKKRLGNLNIRCFIVPIGPPLSPSWLAQALALIKRGRYDAIHAHEFSMNMHCAVLAKWLGIPAVATVHGKNYYADRFVRRMAYRMVARFATMVAVSEDIKQYLVGKVGVPADFIEVVANGIDIEKHRQRPDVREQTRAQIGVGADELLIGAVGNLYPVKGHIHLIRAAAIALQQHPGLRFVVAGRGGEQERLQQEIAELGLTDRFKLLGFREDVDKLLQAFDIFAMPSLSEGMPLSILEAMAARRVVIASHTGGIPQLITHGCNGVLVPPEDPEALARQLGGLVADPRKREAIASKAYDGVCRLYSLDACTTAYLNLYKRRVSRP